MPAASRADRSRRRLSKEAEPLTAAPVASAVSARTSFVAVPKALRGAGGRVAGLGPAVPAPHEARPLDGQSVKGSPPLSTKTKEAPTVPRLLRDASLYDLLLTFDHDLAAEAHAAGCAFCGGTLHSARYRASPEAGRMTSDRTTRSRQVSPSPGSGSDGSGCGCQAIGGPGSRRTGLADVTAVTASSVPTRVPRSRR
jgi:hypothetical protein